MTEEVPTVDGVTIRRAAPADADAMAEIAHLAYVTYLPRLNGQRPAPMDADYVALAGSEETWIAESVIGEVAGLLVLRDDLLENVAVRPSWQGLGIGRRLLALAEERARRAGHRSIRLYTNEAMVENQRLYERIGYAETERRVEDGLARVFYSKHLSEP